jgi:hypothetical protein
MLTISKINTIFMRSDHAITNVARRIFVQSKYTVSILIDISGSAIVHTDVFGFYISI